jgi:ketosteroid isomerase-like protein
MIKKVLLGLFLSLAAISVFASAGDKPSLYQNVIDTHKMTDTIPQPDVIAVVKIVIDAANNFNVQAVANLYTPNAVVADDEPPYSWNGLTAGIQWVNSVEKAVKDAHITKFKGRMEQVNVYQQTVENVYVIVPVTYTGDLPGHAHFSAKGAFAFVLRHIDDRWLIKSQVWMPEKGLGN